MSAAEPSRRQEPILRLENLRFTLGRNSAAPLEFSLPEFSLQPGEQVALTGPSGCGKSTLLNLISGLCKPEAGSICFQGKDLAGCSNAALDAYRGRNIGFIYQTFNLLEGFTALENVLVGMRFGRSIPSGEQKSRAIALLERVGLAHRLHARPSRLSVGERQRVAIARALANRPGLLLGDEPTGALDPETGVQVFDLLQEICASEGCALLLVTHDLTLAEKLPRRFDCSGLLKSGVVA
jgi:ABC-type lipoprotein export system ATPase subunit